MARPLTGSVPGHAAIIRTFGRDRLSLGDLSASAGKKSERKKRKKEFHRQEVTGGGGFEKATFFSEVRRTKAGHRS